MSTERWAQGQDAVVDELVGRLAHNGEGELLGAFAEAYLRRVPLDYLTSHTVDTLEYQIRSVFEFAAARRGEDHVVRVFNPDRDSHGYSAAGTVLEIVAPDMAFLVDSVTNEIEAQGYAVARVIHPVVGTARDATGTLTAILPARSAHSRESIQHYELTRLLSTDQMDALQVGVEGVLLDVRRAVEDFDAMQGAIYSMIKITRAGLRRYDKDEVDEAITFLEWLLDDNFVFLGYREYQISRHDGERTISIAPGSGLGILRNDADSTFATPTAMSQLRPSLRARYEEGDLLAITKTNSQSRVHRRAKMDYIGVRHVGVDGAVIGEARLLGLFTSKAYMTPAESIPVLHRKLNQIIEAEDLIVGSHSYKEVVQLFNTFPQDELFATTTEDIRESIVGLIQVQERRQIRLFVSRDLLQRNVSLLIVMPRDRFNAALRETLQAMFVEEFRGDSVDYRLALGETDTARLHFTVWVRGGEVPNVSVQALEDRVVAAAQTWEEQLGARIVERYGPDIGWALMEEWAGRFPAHYRSATSLDVAAGDVGKLDQMMQSVAGRTVVGLQAERADGEGLTRLAVYRADGKLELSAIMPTLEALGLRVIEEMPTRLRGGARPMFIHAFGVCDAEGSMLDLENVADRVAATVVAVLVGETDSDSLHRLIITAGLNYQQVAVLRAYRTYWRRVSPGFTVEYVNDAFAANPAIAADLMELFSIRFDPARAEADPEPVMARIVVALDQVASLDVDRILRGFLGLILATQRTSAFRTDRTGLSFKFRSADVPGMPLPAPLYEMFVFARDVEGIHLRGGTVARGGIRWSTRMEDYRTEVLGLMKAQMTKNAVIVPTGAKGGFVMRQPPADPSRVGEAVRSTYMTFIRGLLDITDNRAAGEVVHPPEIRVHDGPDPYLVVAADKGTASFSDTANEIAAEYDFWLGDAFASGGSAGYDHKALGITARGAWESVKWHFRELGVDVAKDHFTAIGIGDMSGDVFGNGMLLSRSMKLVAAFDHRHIFIDPDPNPTTAFGERQRLFGLSRSSWADYDTSLISDGGGVYPRAAKRIELSAAARAALGCDTSEFTPDELIKTILRAPVDLLWNGGIGTYVKARGETNEDAGDRVNDVLRVNGEELRCRVVGEGGNLGFTQLGRIEFAMAGGRINADFIDNAGGVHCSDREVNLKILLGLARAGGELTREGRDELVMEVVDDVVAAIIYDSFLQAQILAQEVEASRQRLEAYEDFMVMLEADGMLDRAIEHLPSGDEMSERARNNLGMAAPELSVLLAYAKRSLRRWLLDSDLPDWEDMQPVAEDYFPETVVARFRELIPEHPLRRELIATSVANEVVNSAGITFVTRLMAETGAAVEQVVRAYQISREVTDAPTHWLAVEALVGQVPADLELTLMTGIDDLVESVTRWYLANPTATFMSTVIAEAKPVFEELGAILDDFGPGQWRRKRDAAVAEWIERGTPAAVAHRHVYQEELIHAPDIIEVVKHTGRPVHEVADVFMLAGSAFEIDWLEAQLEELSNGSRWQRRAVQTLQEDLMLVRRQLVERILADAEGHDPQSALQHYLVARTHDVGRLTRFMRSLAADGVTDVASLVVAVRQIRNLAT